MILLIKRKVAPWHVCLTLFSLSEGLILYFIDHLMGPMFISLQIHIRQISWAATAVATLVAHVVTPVADLCLAVLSFKTVSDKLML